MPDLVLSLAECATLVIAGGTGTFGQAMTRLLLARYPHLHIRLLSRSELPQVQMSQALPDPRVTYMLGDVRDIDRLRLAFRGADVVLHAAALKHVPLGEINPEEVVAVNIGGTRNVIRAAIECGVRRAVLLSTDKAVNPTTLYGATKLCAERLFLQANVYTPHGTDFIVPRYGNVMGSRGSVLAIYRDLLRSPGVLLPVTDLAMTRFYMDIDEALALVHDATQEVPKGMLAVPHLPAFALADLCRTVLGLRDDDDLLAAVQITGVRPGEKIHESLLTDDEAAHAYWGCSDGVLIVPPHVFLIPAAYSSWPQSALSPFWRAPVCPLSRHGAYRSDVWPSRLVGRALAARLGTSMDTLDTLAIL